MTPNKEDYLKRIYERSQAPEKMTNKEIAQLMGVSEPATSEMLKKMIQEDWIIKDKVKGYLVTAKGMVQVSNLYRKHRLIEVFLIQNLGYASQDIHQEAEVLEHSVSDQFINQLEIMLQFPDYCPHGGRIPRQQELLQEDFTQQLSQAETGRDYSLRRFPDQPDFIDYLEEQNFHLGTSFHLIKKDNFLQTVELQLPEQKVSLPLNLADQLYVEILQ